MKGSVVLPLWGACGVGQAIAHVRTWLEGVRVGGQWGTGLKLGVALATGGWANLIGDASARSF